MSDDINAGDVVEKCASRCSGHPRKSENPVLRIGAIYRVSGVRPGPFGPPPICHGDALTLVGFEANMLGFCSLGFRKLNDEPDNVEIIARIRKCQPIKTGVPSHAE